MNKNTLHLCAVRPQAASTYRPGSSLRAQWFRNAAGALECRWIAETCVEPHPRRNIAHVIPRGRLHWHSRGAGMRDVSQQNHRG
jgi:hypothetical protein